MAKISTVDQKLKRKDPVKQLDQENFSILFFCEDQNIAHQIRGQNWESEKIHVTFAMDIEEATGLLYETPPTHIVLIDLHDSPICQTLYQEIYEHCKWLDIPIFYSVGEFQEMKQDYLYQFNDVLLYPFTKEEVLLRMQLEQERKNKVKSIENPLLGNGIYDFAFCSFFYQVHLAILARVKKPFTLLFVSVGDQEQPQGLQGTSPMPLYGKSIAERIVSQARDSDFVFKMNHQDLAIILPYSGEKEARYFLKRVQQSLEEGGFSTNGIPEEQSPQLKTSIVEIRNEKAQWNEVIEEGRRALEETDDTALLSINVVNKFIAQETEVIKVSIVESDSIVSSILENLLKDMEINHTLLDITTYSDGNEFLESQSHLSPNTHFVIINDILPKKDGLEIVHELRQLPNTGKYIIFMLSTKKTDEDMIYAFQMGVDDYMTKPFNLRMLEARIKRYLTGLRSTCSI